MISCQENKPAKGSERIGQEMTEVKNCTKWI